MPRHPLKFNDSLLSTEGGDRATAYVMSNKVLALREGHLVTWLDRHCQNRWAHVSREGQLKGTGPLGGTCVDNHCGAAMVQVGNAVHALTGGHHTSFEHYTMNLDQMGSWDHVATLEGKGTYPSLVSTSEGRLHVSYRVPGELWTLEHRSFDGSAWSEARCLVQAHKPGYIYWTNDLSIGPKENSTSCSETPPCKTMVTSSWGHLISTVGMGESVGKGAMEKTTPWEVAFPTCL